MPVNADMLRRAANTHKVKKWLVHYFLNKVGKEKMDRVCDPSQFLDITIMIPPLHTKIEIVPNASNLSLQDDQITLEWNLFVLGNKRMYLGRTAHQDVMNVLSTVRRMEQVNHIHSVEYGTTPKKIIGFIIRILESHEDGYVHWISPQRSIDQILNFGMMNSGHFQNHGMPQSNY